jgi:hypothetical protein
MAPDNERRPGEEAPREGSGAGDRTDAPNVAEPQATFDGYSLNGLLPQHRKLIEGSAILPEVAVARGYRSVTAKADLKRLGFSDYQCNVPTLLVPVYGVEGEIATYQARPDQPRIGKQGKPLKYETPKGSRMAVDVPPRVRPQVGDSSVPLWITEGARKADAGVSAGLCTIALLGVWNWRGTNEAGGKTALADWESIALNGREVYLVFDSDAMEKRPVHQALGRLKAFLESRGAKVKIVYLPDGKSGAKVGLDDFLAAGGTVEELQNLASGELRPLVNQEDEISRAGEYFEQDGCTYWERPTKDGSSTVLLANFTARIAAEVTLDDGLESRRCFEIEAEIGGRTEHFDIPASAFAAMNWPPDKLGARACVAPGLGKKDQFRAAIQMLSGDVEATTVYGHTGWRRIEGYGWVYLHAAGAIGPKGPVTEIHTRLYEAARGMALAEPAEGRDLVEAGRACLRLLDLTEHHISFPLLAATFRAAMGDTDFALLLFGRTGVYKTEIAALFQSFFGTGVDARNLPGSWLSTANALETQAFILKDCLFVVDDFVPDGSRNDVQRQLRDMGRLLRAQGNRAGRGRLSADATPREGRAPRGMLLATCEELPSRHSGLARTLILEVITADTDVLTQCQRDRSQGLCTGLMSAFLKWVAGRYEELKGELGTRAHEFRDKAQSEDRHKRTASIVGELQAGFDLFLQFADQHKVFSDTEIETLRERCWQALLLSAQNQSTHHQAAEPARLFIRLLRSAVASGAAHLAALDGTEPENAEAYGWRQTEVSTDSFASPRLRPQGVRVGWVDGVDIYLDPDAAYKGAQSMASESERIPVSSKTLSRRLKEAGFLATTEEDRGHLTVRRTIEGRRSTVLHIWGDVLTGAAQSAQSDQTPSGDPEKTDSGVVPWADDDRRPQIIGPPDRPTTPATATAEGDGGASGPIGPVPEGYPQPSPATVGNGAVVDDEDLDWEVA